MNGSHAVREPRSGGHVGERGHEVERGRAQPFTSRRSRWGPRSGGEAPPERARGTTKGGGVSPGKAVVFECFFLC